jgi:hypothetical protein
MELRQPTYILDLVPAAKDAAVPDHQVLDDSAAERFLVTEALLPFLGEIRQQRIREIDTISRHMEISLNELINRQNLRMAELCEQQAIGDNSSPVAANIKQTEDRLDELNGRLERRRAELMQERHCTISDIRRVGVAWLLPHPERKAPSMAPFVRDDEIERIAVNAVIAHERSRGWEVVSVEADDRGFDLISKRPHPEDPQTAIEIRFIEVKGRAGIGEIALTTNELKTAQRLRKDYWLYVVFECGTSPQINLVQDPAQLDWKPLVKIEHYHVNAKSVLEAAQ